MGKDGQEAERRVTIFKNNDAGSLRKQFESFVIKKDIIDEEEENPSITISEPTPSVPKKSIPTHGISTPSRSVQDLEVKNAVQ